jgi:hypothetical protein
MTVDLTKSRYVLPASMLDRSSYSIFSVINQAVGKDLTRFSIPVISNGIDLILNIFFIDRNFCSYSSIPYADRTSR